ncbi:MAG: hypothetical protein C0613_01325 [Desulfobulbaceae bacterium]|nr:MAG: hypothetical protein C0613_01325 [Desulfobulbaceae bacterium]
MSEARPVSRAWSWKMNLLAFGLVTVAVLLYSLGQVYYLRQTLKGHLADNRQMILAAINHQIELGTLAEEALNETILLFLSNSARFLNFLNDVEAFDQQELASFADENGLTGVAVLGPEGRAVSGPAGWAEVISCVGNRDLLSKKSGYFLLSWPRPQGGCILIGYPDRPLRKVQEQFSLTSILTFLASSPQISLLEVAEPGRDYGDGRADTVLETLVVDGRQVVVGFDTRLYRQQVRRIWQNFILYASFFAGFGLLLTFILYRLQQQHIAEITRYERELARQQEDAVLGRAAATIAHEVRNPLNAIGLGLQRVEMEANLEDEHKALLAAMEKAMRRTNTIVEGLLRYSRPVEPHFDAVDLDRLLQQQLLLRKPQCTQANIEVEYDGAFVGRIEADADLLAQLFDNIIKNGIEAQPAGGWLHVETRSHDDGVLVSFANPGFQKSADIDRLAEPYFSGKVRGSGLGLAICAKIVESHRGILDFKEIRPGVLQVGVWLPGVG